MAEEKILVVDDEEALTELLKAWLEEEGYQVTTAQDGSIGLKEFFKHQPDLAIVDIVMPGLSGFDLCQRIREVSEIPVIVLSAKGMEMDKVQGLNLGADEYLVKPIGRQELLARIAAALRRAGVVPQTAPTNYSDGIITLDYAKHEAYVRGEKIALTPTEYRLLANFVKHADQVLTQQQLWDRVWGSDFGSLESVKWHIAYLRKKIEENPQNPSLIVTVRGVGYRYQVPR